ncbi:MAG: carbohydrate ABC transporter permease [Phycisphaeraceae bacterium]|nr:carbohydrate ABC transporter permease [Phycisphaeraceae bacterium]
MPLISTIGRKSLSVRLLIGSIYLVLTIGSVTMLYPFLLMIAGSTKSNVDINEMRIIPGFLSDDDVLYRKYVEGLFNEYTNNFKSTYNTEDSKFEVAKVPTQVNDKLVDSWDSFLQRNPLPQHASMVGMMQASVSRSVQPILLRKFMRQLSEEYDDKIENINHALEVEFTNWSTFVVRDLPKTGRRNVITPSLFNKRLAEFYAQQADVYRYYPSITGMYLSQFLKTQYTRDIDVYNKTHDTHYASYDDVYLPRTYPVDGTPMEKEDWENFVRQSLNLLWLTADESARPIFTEFLKARYPSIDQLNEAYDTNHVNYQAVPMGGMQLSTPKQMVDWQNMIEGWINPDSGKRLIIPLEMIRVDSVDFRYADDLIDQYGTIENVNATLGTHYRNVADIQTPQRQWHYRLFEQIKGDLRWEFCIRNYVTVFNYIVLHGRGVFNTVVYCVLAVIAALIVNPMAAYAMSRYKMPSTYKVLLFLMLTMAFPPMVTQIPNFLMLRELGLLNTFAALILPSLANGYSIFLLKGFFDSLPRELYESAGLDGANEWVMFWQITMNLSKPILAVIALAAFNFAYANFMFALLTCQDEKMWTLMVWLYQLQSNSTQGVVFASLMIAAFPTFIVFAFAQNIIMRGIVVPVEK